MSHEKHDTHHVNYLMIFFVLMGCTGLSVFFDLDLGLPYPAKVVLVLSVAVAKAMCVMMFFMHLKFEGNWKFVLLAPTTILAIGLPLALLPDIGVSYYTSIAPQQRDWKLEIAADGGHGGHAKPEHIEDTNGESEPHVPAAPVQHE